VRRVRVRVWPLVRSSRVQSFRRAWRRPRTGDTEYSRDDRRSVGYCSLAGDRVGYLHFRRRRPADLILSRRGRNLIY